MKGQRKLLSVLQSQRKNNKTKKKQQQQKKTTTKKTQQKIPNFVKGLLIACKHHTQHNS